MSTWGQTWPVPNPPIHTNNVHFFYFPHVWSKDCYVYFFFFIWLPHAGGLPKPRGLLGLPQHRPCLGAIMRASNPWGSVSWRVCLKGRQSLKTVLNHNLFSPHPSVIGVSKLCLESYQGVTSALLGHLQLVGIALILLVWDHIILEYSIKSCWYLTKMPFCLLSAFHYDGPNKPRNYWSAVFVLKIILV